MPKLQPNYPELHAKKFLDTFLLQAKASFAEIRRGARTTPGGVSARLLRSGSRRWAAAAADIMRRAHMEPLFIFKSILLLLLVVQRRLVRRLGAR
jgi:hypothetical protein